VRLHSGALHGKFLAVMHEALSDQLCGEIFWFILLELKEIDIIGSLQQINSRIYSVLLPACTSSVLLVLTKI
jgi:hypothetical protein